jgi:CPA2 family monovalent cation:H+ antiporter-2
MVHETDILATLTAAVVAAAVGGHLAALIRMPPILGFLLAGVVVGPFTPGPTADASVAGQLAEFGIILLMFGVGIHFSLRELRAVLGIVLPAAIIQAALVTFLVAGLMSLFGWGLGAGLLLGLAISIASTVIVVHAFDRRGELESLHGRVAVGWLVIEDLLTVLVLILIPILSDPGDGRSLETLTSAVGVGMAKVIALSAVMILVGARIVPRLLVFTARLNSRELRLVTVLALALGIAYGSAQIFDVSFALGAFLAGLVISEADLSHQAAADALPLQDAFAALFFVSVGMLLDPRFLIEEPELVVLVVVLIVALKPVVTLLLLAALRFPERSGLLIAVSRAQIGEFSFVLGSVGLAEGIFDDDRVSLILAGSIISILLNPLLFAGAERFSAQLHDRLPLRFPVQPFTGELETSPNGLRGHAIILGGGRVGGLIVRELQTLRVPLVVVDHQREVVDRFRAAGIPVVYGDAANPLLLEHLEVPHARVFVVAIADPIATRLAIERVRAISPDLPVVVRTHSERERAYVDVLPNAEAIMAERELAVEMTSFVLRQFGVTLEQLEEVRQDLRSRPEEERAISPMLDV